MVKSWIISLVVLMLLGTSSHALPNEQTIKKILYDLDQTTMKVDIMYQHFRQEYIRKHGMEKWEDFILEAGKNKHTLGRTPKK